MTPQPKEQSHSPLFDSFAEIAINAVKFVGSANYAEREREALLWIEEARVGCNDSHARLLAQNEMLRKALEEMLHYDSVGCVCPTEEIRSRNPCTTCKARAALEQTEKV